VKETVYWLPAGRVSEVCDEKTVWFLFRLRRWGLKLAERGGKNAKNIEVWIGNAAEIKTKRVRSKRPTPGCPTLAEAAARK
jgi:hypothetical protein